MLGRPRALAGGAIHASWRLAATIEGGHLAGNQDLVLRCAVAPAHSESRSLAAQAALLQTARAQGCPAPEPLWLATEAEGFAREYLLLRWVVGEADPVALAHVSATSGGGEGLAREIGRTLACIHALKPSHPALAWLGAAPGDPVRQGLERLASGLARLAEPQPTLAWALGQLERAAPRGRPVALAHRDFRVGNLVIERDRVAAVLDWEFAGWSDPLEDYGWFTAKCWRRHAPERIAGGIGPLDAFAAGYAEGGGEVVAEESLRFWQAFAHLRWALIALEQAARGRANGDPELQALSERLPEIARELQHLLA
ncbi:MAG: phosphotransferase family protein [Alphaproteobacteria bacterium]|nr:phosphotransferase family protein [Alphaproteobacteria bacterium]